MGVRGIAWSRTLKGRVTVPKDYCIFLHIARRRRCHPTPGGDPRGRTERCQVLWRLRVPAAQAKPIAGSVQNRRLPWHRCHARGRTEPRRLRDDVALQPLAAVPRGFSPARDRQSGDGLGAGGGREQARAKAHDERPAPHGRRAAATCAGPANAPISQAAYARPQRPAEEPTPMPTPPAALPPLIPRAKLFGNPTRAQGQISPDGRWLSWLAPRDGRAQRLGGADRRHRRGARHHRRQEARHPLLRLGLHQPARALHAGRGRHRGLAHLRGADRRRPGPRSHTVCRASTRASSS